MGKTGFSLVLALFLVTVVASSERKCILTGDWQNDLGSNMTISAVNGAGQFSGLYLTAVSATEKPILVSPLNGSQHVDNLEQPTFGFTVKWSFSDSTTVFVGQCFTDDHGKETLQTMWLLRDKAKSMDDNWNATTVDSTTVFVGQCFVDDKGKETLKTMWLLREEVGSPGDGWRATRVGTNVFTRKRNVERGKILQQHSPPCDAPTPTPTAQ
ncbi:unnamed protein product [Caretta caretta]